MRISGSVMVIISGSVMVIIVALPECIGFDVFYVVFISNNIKKQLNCTGVRDPGTRQYYAQLHYMRVLERRLGVSRAT